LYAHSGGSALLFALLFIRTGCIDGWVTLKNPKVGSLIYNVVHTYITPSLLLMLISLIAGSALGTQIRADLVCTHSAWISNDGLWAKNTRTQFKRYALHPAF